MAPGYHFMNQLVVIQTTQVKRMYFFFFLSHHVWNGMFRGWGENMGIWTMSTPLSYHDMISSHQCMRDMESE